MTSIPRWFGTSIVAVILVLMLTPLGPAAHQAIVDHVVPGIGPRRLDAGLNLLLFVPFGVWSALRHRSSALVAAPVLSIAIELVQLGVVGRNADLVDVITNTTGAVVGFVAVAVFTRTGRRVAAVGHHAREIPSPERGGSHGGDAVGQ